jgi:hypothetical protein
LVRTMGWIGDAGERIRYIWNDAVRLEGSHILRIKNYIEPTWS